MRRMCFDRPWWVGFVASGKTFAVCALLLIAAPFSCGGERENPDEPSPDGGSELLPDVPEGDVAQDDVVSPPVSVYYGDVEEIFQANCVGCHVEGGIGPFELNEYDSIYEVRAAVRIAVESGIMPPWHASSECRDYEAVRSLSEGDVARVLEWIDEGAHEGDKEDELIIEAPPVAEEPELVLSAGAPFLPPDDVPDTYRCLVLEHEFLEDMWIRGLKIIPDKTAQVHHVIISAVAEDSVAALEALDEADPGLGYQCFGTIGINSAERLSSWVPGPRDPFLGPGEAFAVRAGSKLVMQMHYNLLAGTPQPDQSELAVYLYEGTPEFIMQSVFLINPNILIPPGDDHSEHITYIENQSAKSATIVGSGPHMHLRGSALNLELERVNGETECLLDVPNYDFNWQEGYRFLPGEEVVVDPGDRFMLRCVYDNSAENQPIVEGVPATPELITWGDGTEAEMCLAGLSIAVPFEEYIAGESQAFPSIVSGGPTGVCLEFNGCVSECDEPNTYTCLADCAGESLGCMQCVLEGLELACGSSCYDGQSVIPCIIDCVGAISDGETGLGTCIAEVCPEVSAQLNACFGPLLAAGQCDSIFDSCSK